MTSRRSGDSSPLGSKSRGAAAGAMLAFARLRRLITSKARAAGQSFERGGLVVSLAVVTLSSSCSRQGADCQRRLEAEDYPGAAQTCLRAFEETRDPSTGIAAAQAQFMLSQHDAVLAWPERLRGTTQEATALGWAAASHDARGDKQAVEKARRSALALQEAARDFTGASNSLHALFYLAWEATKHREALEYARRALEMALAGGDRRTVWRAALGLHTVLLEVGDLEGARLALEAAEATPRGGGRAEDPGQFRLHVGLIRFHEGRPELARHSWEAALAEAADGQHREFYRRTHLNLTEVNLRLGEVDRAASHLDAASRYIDHDGPLPTSLLCYRAQLEHARGNRAAAGAALGRALAEKPVPGWEWELEWRRGLLEEELGRVGPAEQAYRRAVEILEDMRADLRLEDFKAWLLEDKRAPFEALFALQARLPGRWPEALETAERLSARAFLEAFVRAAAGPNTTGEDPLRQSTVAAADRLDALQSLLPAVGHSTIVALRPAARLVRGVGQRHVLVYFLARERLWLVTVGGGRIRAHALAIAPRSVSELAAALLADPDDASASTSLSEALLPRGALPAAGEPVYLVTDRILEGIPFSALRNGDRYLVQDHAVARIPSLNALIAIESPARSGYGPPLVLGDATGDLPASAAEARDVAALLGVAPLTAREATFQALNTAPHAGVLHLATHAGSGPAGPWLSLADGRVTAEAIMRARLGSRMVVLASCGSGASRRGGVSATLAAAFLAAGSKGVLATLWSVDDASAHEFVVEFYRQGGATQPMAALARAQNRFIRLARQPSFWSAFAFFGSGQSSTQKQEL